ncbi:MAG: hypothetical protein ACK41C_02830 [Phenylobacterium sp.]|uniref:hypothetical protein n=1 Tax=Phenylobacterium sp. TaxID=1871053 RepID=UPI00391C9204
MRPGGLRSQERPSFAADDATLERPRRPLKERWRAECEQIHVHVVVTANTGLRPDEASRLQYRDVSIINDEATGQRILEIKVRGKRGTGYCKSMPEAVPAVERLSERSALDPSIPIFGKVQRQFLNRVLDELGLKRDREGICARPIACATPTSACG